MKDQNHILEIVKSVMEDPGLPALRRTTEIIAASTELSLNQVCEAELYDGMIGIIATDQTYQELAHRAARTLISQQACEQVLDAYADIKYKAEIDVANHPAFAQAEVALKDVQRKELQAFKTLALEIIEVYNHHNAMLAKMISALAAHFDLLARPTSVDNPPIGEINNDLLLEWLDKVMKVPSFDLYDSLNPVFTNQEGIVAKTNYEAH